MKLFKTLFLSFFIVITALFMSMLFMFQKEVNQNNIQSQYDTLITHINYFQKYITQELLHADDHFLKNFDSNQISYPFSEQNRHGNSFFWLAEKEELVQTSDASVRSSANYKFQSHYEFTQNPIYQKIVSYVNMHNKIDKPKFFLLEDNGQYFLSYMAPIKNKNTQKMIVGTSFIIKIDWLKQHTTSEISFIPKDSMYGVLQDDSINENVGTNEFLAFERELKIDFVSKEEWILSISLSKKDLINSGLKLHYQAAFLIMYLMTLAMVYLLLRQYFKPFIQKIDEIKNDIQDSHDNTIYKPSELSAQATLGFLQKHLQTVSEQNKLLDQKLKAHNIKNTSEKNIHRLKTQFLIKMNDEIKSMLSGVLKMIVSFGNTRLSIDQKRVVQTLYNNHRMLLTSFNDYQNISTSFFNQFQIKTEIVETENLFSNLKDFLRSTLYKKNQKKFHFEYSNIPEHVLCDPYRMIQVFSQLCLYLNSCLIQGTQSVHIHGYYYGKLIQLKCKIDIEGDFYIEDTMLEVINNYEQDSHIHMADSISQNEFGLIVACEILTLLNIPFSIENHEGKVSIQLNIQLPVPSKEQVKQTLIKPITIFDENNQSKAAKQNKVDLKNILIIDNNHTNAKIMSIFLEDLGCNVIKIDDSKKGIECFKKHDFDLVFIRLKLPIVDGFQATKIIRQIEIDNADLPYHVPIIGIDDSVKVEQDQLILCGLNDLVVTPLRKMDINKIIKHWLKMHNNRIEKSQENMIFY